MENSRNKQFITFKLGTILSSVMNLVPSCSIHLGHKPSLCPAYPWSIHYPLVSIGKNIAYLGFGTIWGFRYPLRVLEDIPMDKGDYCTLESQKQISGSILVNGTVIQDCTPWQAVSQICFWISSKLLGVVDGSVDGDNSGTEFLFFSFYGIQQVV